MPLRQTQLNKPDRRVLRVKQMDVQLTHVPVAPPLQRTPLHLVQRRGADQPVKVARNAVKPVPNKDGTKRAGKGTKVCRKLQQLVPLPLFRKPPKVRKMADAQQPTLVVPPERVKRKQLKLAVFARPPHRK